MAPKLGDSGCPSCLEWQAGTGVPRARSSLVEPGLHQVKQGGWYSRYRYEYVVLSFYKYTLSAHHVPAGIHQ